MAKRNATARARNTQLLAGLGLIAIALAVVGLGWMVWSVTFSTPPFTPKMTTLTFTRDIARDTGRLDSSKIFSSAGPKILLSEVFSDVRRTALLPPYGEGLKVTFTTFNGGQQIGPPVEFSHVGWTRFEEDDNPDRVRKVREGEKRFADLVEKFTAPVIHSRVRAVVLDTTDGVKTDTPTTTLAGRVNDLINSWAGGGCDNGSVYLAYKIGVANGAYQGGRQKAPLCSANNAFVAANTWLLQRTQAGNSSPVFEGLVAILDELAQLIKEDPATVVELHLFTDGIQNSGQLNAYHQKWRTGDGAGMFKGDNWAALDTVLDLRRLNLRGVTIHLHEVPTRSPEENAWMKAAHGYIAARLEWKGAVVNRLSF